MKNAEWMQLLDQLTAALEGTSLEVTRHEQTLASPLLTSDLSGERHISWQRALERFGERLNDCRAHIEQAERQTQQAESAMGELEKVVTNYHGKIEEVKKSLASAPK
jgi:chromosome segregation ATPase